MLIQNSACYFRSTKVKMYRTKTNFKATEEAFLLSTFSEFMKCWKSSKKSRLFIESVNGMAFMNFSVFLGDPILARHIHLITLHIHRGGIRHPKRIKGRNHQRKSNVTTNVRRNFRPKRGKSRLLHQQQVVTHLLQRPLLNLL